MTWFPFHYRDLQAFTNEGLDFSTPSNEAIKLYDSALTQMTFSNDDPISGNMSETLTKMFAADPNFIMGKIMTLTLKAFETCSRTNHQLIYDVKDFKQKSKSMKMTKLEKFHLEALDSMMNEDIENCAKIYDEILFDYPKDIFAVNMAYFTSVFAGQRDLTRNVMGRVVTNYEKSERFYGSIHGKLCFGYEEMYQYGEAEKAGQIALAHTPNDIFTIHSISHLKEETQRYKSGA